MLRTQTGIGQAALAHQLSLTRQKIASYEAGLVEPNARVFLSVCAFFQIDPVMMLNEEILPSRTLLKKSVNHLEEGGSETRKPERARVELALATAEFDKILDGYEIFKSSRKYHAKSEDEAALSSLYEDILSIMHMISETNHKFLGKDNMHT